MIKAWRHFPFGRPIGAELAGNDPFGRHFLNLTQAQIEPNVEPDRMDNDLRRKAVALVANDGVCISTGDLQIVDPASKVVNVKTP